MTLTPRSLSELQEAVAASAPAPLRIRGGGSKRLARAATPRSLDTARSWPASSPTTRPSASSRRWPARRCARSTRALGAHGQYLPFDPPLARPAPPSAAPWPPGQRARPLSLRRRPRLRDRRRGRRRRGPPDPIRRPGGQERRRVPAPPCAGRQRRTLRRDRRGVLQGVPAARGAGHAAGGCRSAGARRSTRTSGCATPCPTSRRSTSISPPTRRGSAWRDRPRACRRGSARIREVIGGTSMRRCSTPTTIARAWEDAAEFALGDAGAPLVKVPWPRRRMLRHARR